MNTRTARKARKAALFRRVARHQPYWGHLEQTVFLMALAIGASPTDADEVWNRVRAEPVLPTLKELATLVESTLYAIWDARYLEAN